MAILTVFRYLKNSNFLRFSEVSLSLGYITQMQRRKRVKDVCKQYSQDGGSIGSRDPTYFKGRSPLYSEEIQRDAFLIAHLPPTILCYNNKACA